MKSEDASVSSVSKKRRLSSVEEVFSVFCNPFGGHLKTSSGPNDLTRSLPGHGLRPAFSVAQPLAF